LKNWASSWITKAGVNDIEPVVVTDDDAKTFKMSLKQSFPTHGDQVLRE
jgi:hypothetical protein